jgi:hypothetical protein
MNFNVGLTVNLKCVEMVLKGDCISLKVTTSLSLY